MQNIAIGIVGYAADGVHDAEGDFTILDEAGEGRQESRDRVAGRLALLQAAC
jgi:hypothetical protein